VTIRRQALAMERERAAAIRADSPTGQLFVCRRCGHLAGTPRRRVAVGRVECPAGVAEFEERPE
jgi:hypothetical protein